MLSSILLSTWLFLILLLQKNEETTAFTPIITTLTTGRTAIITTNNANKYEISTTQTTSSSNTSNTALFASKKKKKKKKNNTSSGGGVGVIGASGFGQSTQPKLQDLEFPTRIPPNPLEQPCPCGILGPTTTYQECCHPLHNKDILPQSPMDVLKSRYTAFVWRMIPYVIETTHPSSRDYIKDQVKWARDLNRSGMFDSYDFIGLDAGEEEYTTNDDSNSSSDDDGKNEDKKEGFIEFKVNLRANQNCEEFIEGQEIVVQERSRFLRSSSKDGGWKYAGGDVTSNVAGLEGAKLNN